jgi:hypothetical protein
MSGQIMRRDEVPVDQTVRPTGGPGPSLRSGESHLGGFAKIDEVLELMRSQL